MKSIVEYNIKSTLAECFSTDIDLLEKYHIYSGKGIDACVNKTLEDILSVEENYTFYKVTSSDELVGFFGVEKCGDIQALTGFFIKPSYRSNKKEFWNLVREKMNSKPFICGIYNKNTRASKFLESFGGRVVFNQDGMLVFRMEC